MQYESPRKSAKSHLFRSALPIQEMISRAASGSCFSESNLPCVAFVIVLKHKIPIINDKSRALENLGYTIEQAQLTQLSSSN
jgi:hypothetical protein